MVDCNKTCLENFFFTPENDSKTYLNCLPDLCLANTTIGYIRCLWSRSIDDGLPFSRQCMPCKIKMASSVSTFTKCGFFFSVY